MRKSFKLEEELFAAALALPATERDCYLERACDGDPSLRARVSTLLDAFQDGASFIKERSRVSQLENTGDKLGNYRLLQEIGEGGCGVVYLAEQTAPIKREVALKIIKLGMDTKAVIARFEAERQALALMDHPNIAKVFDAGATPTGRPYFVMELVRGIKITEYCDQTRLDIPHRLALFIQVCQAIQHAHHKGIIHRDIKPSNVLVTLHDGAPVAKVIDFGIAKATQGRLTDQTLYTALEQFIGTPAYVSPEQFQLGEIEADTRSDIYSLGVLLYELLTGCTPFDTAELLQVGLDEMRQRIREQEPPSPSRRLSTLADELITSTSERYQTSATKLIRQIHGDLDWVAMRCLEKECARRYQTANDLVLDLQRYLHHEPVGARPPSVTYAFRKFARRHRMIFATGATIIGVLLIATGISTWQAIRATRAEVLAQEMTASLLGVFSTADPFTSQGTEFTANELLERAGRAVRDDLSQYPEVRARLLESIGLTYRRRGDADRSVGYLEDALHIRRKMPAVDGSATLTAMAELAVTLRFVGDLKGSEKLLKEAIALARRLGQEHTAVYARLITNRGRVEVGFGNIEAGRKYFEESLALNREVLGSRDTEVAVVLMELSRMFQWTDDLQAAERTVRDAIDILEATVPPLHPDRVLADERLGEVLHLQNRLTEAAVLFEKSLERQKLLFGKNSWQVTDALDSLTKVRRSQGLLAEAEDFAREAVRIATIYRGKEHRATAYYRGALAIVLAHNAKYAEAELQLRQALATFSKTIPPDHQYVASTEHALGEVLLKTNRFKDAEVMFTAAMNRWKRAGAPAWRAARSASGIGEALYRQGRAHEAEQYLVDSYRALVSDPKGDREARVEARERIESFYSDRGQPEKLEKLMLATNRGPADSSRDSVVSGKAEQRTVPHLVSSP